MLWRCVLGAAAALLLAPAALAARSAVTLRNSGYEGLVLAIADTVPYEECDQIIDNLKASMAEASQYLNSALDGRAFFRSATVLFPSSWKGDCGQTVQPASGEMATRADIRITPPHLLFADALWTQQSQGCGKPGDFISLAYTRLISQAQQTKELGRALVREWAKLRYGVFDEAGVPGDAVYPPCYHDEKDGAARVSGCSDKHQNTEGLCENVTQLLLAGDTDTLTPLLVHPEATSSIMFAHTSPSVTRFCDHTTHNRYAPTKHNAMCNRRSVMEVILENDDFRNVPADATPYFGDTTPKLTFKREALTRYVLVIEDTNDMLVRESWGFLRSAVRKFAIHDLPVGSEVGIVTVNGTDAVRLQRLVSLNSKTRDPVASILPFTPGDGFGSTKVESSSCLPCGVSTAIDMLTEHGDRGGSSVILVIAPGTGRLGELLNLGNQARALGIRIATINYPQLARPTHSSLDALAHLTGAPAFTVHEQRQNQEHSFLNAYFELTQAMLAIKNEFFQGDRSKLPVEIYRRELTDNGQRKVTGTFVVPPGLGEPSQVHVYLHNSNTPLVKQVTLTSPSQRIYTSKSDELLNIKILKINAIINETGTWTYSIDRHPGSQQPHFIVVTATPQSFEQRDAPVSARLFTSSEEMRLDGQSGPLALYVEVKQGDWPVLSAKVEVRVTKVGNSSGLPYEHKLELLDTGSGDPDVTRGDGVYSRYFVGHSQGGAGTYRFEVFVDDNSNTAYTWQTMRDSLGRRSVDTEQMYPSGQLLSVNSASGRCCGSAIWPQAVHQLVAFQRVLQPLDIEVAAGAAERVEQILPPARINDLRVLPQATGEVRARLQWTAPGANGDVGSVDHYEIRYASDLASLVDGFDSSQLWPTAPSMQLPAGAEMSHSLDFSENPQLLDQPIFVAVRGLNGLGASGHVSNVVRLLVVSPPRPSAPSGPDFDRIDPSVIPRVAPTTSGLILQVVLPVAAGVVVLAVCVSLYCVMVVHRRKRHSKEPPPSQPPPPQQPYSGPPPRYEAEDDYNKQRDKSIYSTATLSPVVAVDAPTGQIVNARTLSPYQSWTASQLLHEHERRVSPYGYVQHYAQDGPPVPPPPQDSSVYTVNYYNNSFLSIADESAAIYGQRPKQGPPTLPKPNVNFNPSLQGSLSSVNSDKKKRNVTMV